MSADVIAKPVGVTKDSVYAWIAKKDMPSHRVQRLGKFKDFDVDEWVRRKEADDTANFTENQTAQDLTKAGEKLKKSV